MMRDVIPDVEGEDPFFIRGTRYDILNFLPRRSVIMNNPDSVSSIICHYEASPTAKPSYNSKTGTLSVILEWGDLFSLRVPQNLGTILTKADNRLACSFPISSRKEAPKITEGSDYGYIIRFSYVPKRIGIALPPYSAMLPDEGLAERKSGRRPSKKPKINDYNLEDLEFEICDVILYKKSTGEIVWSALSGDHSSELRK